jgi:hypothetical protein
LALDPAENIFVRFVGMSQKIMSCLNGITAADKNATQF